MSGPRSQDPQGVQTAATHLTVPSHPENLTAEAGPGAGEISLDWDPPHHDGGSPIDHYEIYRDGLWIANVTSTSYVDSGLGNGESHHYSAAAVNEDGEAGDPCGIEWATTYDVPSAPQDLIAKAAPGQVELTWDPPVDDGGADVTSYHVYADGTRVATVDATRLVDDGLDANVTRTYHVSAENVAGEGPLSNATSATTPDIPAAPRSVSAKAGPGVGEVSLDWDAPADDGGEPVTAYRIHRDGSPVAEVPSTGYVDEGLADDTSYAYRVSAVNAVGEGPAGPTVQAGTFATPEATWWIVAGAGPKRGELTVQWAPPRDTGGQPVDHYRVYRDGSFYKSVTDRKLLETGLGDDVRHVYRVAAVNDVGEGPRSERAAATTWSPPDAPRDLRARSAQPTSGDLDQPVAVSVDWKPPADDGGQAITEYRIYRGTSSGNVSRIADVTGGTTHYLDEGLDPTANYFYRVDAVNDLGRGALSGRACSGPFPWVAPLDAATGEACTEWRQS